MSLRKAINAKCKECIYDEKSGLGGSLQQINACTSTSCPLFKVRPRITAKRHISQVVEHKAQVLFGKERH